MNHSEDRVCRVVAETFGIPMEKVSEDAGVNTIENWDSLAHLNLIMAIEAEFGISLTPEEAMQIMSVRLIRLTLEEHGVITPT